MNDAVAALRRSVLEAPPEQQLELIATMRAELDALVLTVTERAERAKAQDPIVRAQQMARFPELIAAQRDRERASRASAPEKS
jgi:hypothetical protein